MFAFRSVERLPKTSFHQPLADFLHGLATAGKRLGNLLVRPVRPVRVRLQQNLSPPDLLTCSLQFLDYCLKFLAFLIRQPNNILLLHGDNPPWLPPIFLIYPHRGNPNFWL